MIDKQIKARLDVIQGDITKLAVDAIVNAANSSLLGGGGVDGAIHRGAGPQLLAECRALGGCPTGEARMTGGYNLPARHVIHTVGPVFRQQAEFESARLLANCYRNSLILARKHRLKTVAFPAISCGVYGYPIENACQIALKTTGDILASDSILEKVTFVLFSKTDCEVYKNQLNRL